MTPPPSTKRCGFIRLAALPNPTPSAHAPRNSTARAPAPSAAVANTPPAAPTKETAPEKVRTVDNPGGLIPMTRGPRPDPVPPLTQEELDLLAADPATLTPELRRKRGHAMRRKILQNPDSPAARELERMRLATERGEIKPQLPGDSGLVFTTPYPTIPNPPAPAPAPPPAPSP